MDNMKQPEANKWRENKGVQPVGDDVEVDIWFRMDEFPHKGHAIAGEMRWTLEGNGGDIIKWRFHNPEDANSVLKEESPAGEFSGGDVNYYLLKVDNPKRLSPYECEAEDIIEALNMTFAEGNVFKALWRSCAMRVRGHGKAGQDEHGVYDGDKIAYYGERVKVQRRREAGK